MDDELTLASEEREEMGEELAGPYAALREHYEGPEGLSDAEIDQVADLAIGYVRDLLG